jgi:tryptophan synthase beta chain
VKRITTETGAGQWGCALAYACQMFGIDLKVYMVRVSYEQKPYRKAMMHLRRGGRPEPERRTRTPAAGAAAGPGLARLAGHRDQRGGRGRRHRDDTKYSLGSVLNHVLLHQTVIGQEAMLQMEMAGEEPDVVIGCVGGGSNYAGLAFPFMRGG